MQFGRGGVRLEESAQTPVSAITDVLCHRTGPSPFVPKNTGGSTEIGWGG